MKRVRRFWQTGCTLNPISGRFEPSSTDERTFCGVNHKIILSPDSKELGLFFSPRQPLQGVGETHAPP